MVKKRIIGTIVTAALGLSLVGAANADTVDNLMSPKGMDGQQAKANITQQEMIAKEQKMPYLTMDKAETRKEITVVTKDTKDTNDTKDTKDTKDTENNKKEKQDAVRIYPNQMTQMPESMVEFHEKNYDEMVDMHESMQDVPMHGDMGQMSRQMHNGGMHGMMGK
ncbi:hypothetical protein [Dehalobacterium formicoaceticum]|uniref:Uncharacterized protein n=1 Tax=Dehalobacterium formicoaceticum TaxID=51515 RepID=A0ABT1Y4H8_9FIRM|nr:hypothetical protein [Dehalobacterium formicoaceticum]MCR6545775.1 hypothetical protein [Dehalobacterium formicoaceticum]